MEIQINESQYINLIVVKAVLSNGSLVGYAKVSIAGNTANLSDLYVTDKIGYRWPSFMSLPFSFKRKHNFRNNGIGTKLLLRSIDLAKLAGCNQMKGWMHGDIERLQLFYTSLGFEISGINILKRI